MSINLCFVSNTHFVILGTFSSTTSASSVVVRGHKTNCGHHRFVLEIQRFTYIWSISGITGSNILGFLPQMSKRLTDTFEKESHLYMHFNVPHGVHCFLV